jgi:pyridoxamine 5'-phosphate oxidase
MSIAPTDNPFDLFRQWFDEAERNEPDNPNAMSLATVGADGAPSIRMVLLKGVDDTGFVFYTNLESRKGGELLGNSHAALCFHWKSLRRQVRIEGEASLVDDAEADAYYASRARGSQIGAWASAQSRPLSGKAELLKQVASYTAKFGVSRVPRPPHWSGFRVVPEVIEFWREGQFRLHDRLVYRRTADGWTTQVLYP